MDLWLLAHAIGIQKVPIKLINSADAGTGIARPFPSIDTQPQRVQKPSLEECMSLIQQSITEFCPTRSSSNCRSRLQVKSMAAKASLRILTAPRRTVRT